VCPRDGAQQTLSLWKREQSQEMPLSLL